MYESDEEKLTDHVIGEAVLGLLNDNARISSASLIARLDVMAGSETDERRKQAIKAAISEVRRGIPARRSKRPLTGRDNDSRSARFDADAPPAGTKKH